MDKNNIIGFLLIAVVLIGFSWYNQPSAEEQRAAFVQDSIAQAKKELAAKQAVNLNKVDSAKLRANADTTLPFHQAMKGIAQDITLKNNKVELTLSSKGAIVKKAVIKGYVGHDLQHQNHTDDKNYVTLFDATSQSLNYSLATKEANINTADLYFEPSSYNDSTVTFTATSKAGQTITNVNIV